MKGKVINIYKPIRDNNSMKVKLFLLVLFSILLVNFVFAGQQSLGAYKQNECINLIQTCSNCSYVNITSIISPNAEQILGNVEMTKDGTLYNRTFCSTSLIGNYVVNGVGDLDGLQQVWNYDFEITPSGYTGTLGFYIILLIALGGCVVLGFSISEGWFVVIGGMGFMILGVYSIINGMAGFKDMFMTWTISIFFIGIGAYLAFKSAMEMMEDINLS